MRERGIEAFRAMIEGAVCGLLWRALDLSREAEGASLTRGAPARTRSGWSVARRLAATRVGAGGCHQDRREALRVLDARSRARLSRTLLGRLRSAARASERFMREFTSPVVPKEPYLVVEDVADRLHCSRRKSSRRGKTVRRCK